MATIKHLKILHITPFFAPNIGGVETHLSDLTTTLDKLGYQNTILTYSPITTPQVTWKKTEHFGHNSTVYRFSWIGLNLFHKLERQPFLNLIYITPYLLIRSIIWLLFHPQQFLVLHSHGINAAIIGIIIKNIFHIPKHIISIYSTYDNVPINNFSTKFMVYILNHTDQVLTQSQQSIKQLKNLGVNINKLSLYRHWIDQSQFKPLDQLKTRFKFNIENKFSILFVGRMIPQKGAYILAQAAAKLPDINFLFVGIGPDYQKIQELTHVNKNIKLLGNVPYSQLHYYYNLADIFCIPSLYNEGWGRVVMEALACGLPIIASNRGAITEVVDNTVAIIINPTATNFIKNINNLYQNHRLYLSLKDNATNYANKNFSKNSVQLITKHYLTS